MSNNSILLSVDCFFLCSHTECYQFLVPGHFKARVQERCIPKKALSITTESHLTVFVTLVNLNALNRAASVTEVNPCLWHDTNFLLFSNHVFYWFFSAEAKPLVSLVESFFFFRNPVSFNIDFLQCRVVNQAFRHLFGSINAELVFY